MRRIRFASWLLAATGLALGAGAARAEEPARPPLLAWQVTVPARSEMRFLFRADGNTHLTQAIQIFHGIRKVGEGRFGQTRGEPMLRLDNAAYEPAVFEVRVAEFAPGDIAHLGRPTFLPLYLDGGEGDWVLSAATGERRPGCEVFVSMRAVLLPGALGSVGS